MESLPGFTSFLSMTTITPDQASDVQTRCYREQRQCKNGQNHERGKQKLTSHIFQCRLPAKSHAGLYHTIILQSDVAVPGGAFHPDNQLYGAVGRPKFCKDFNI